MVSSDIQLAERLVRGVPFGEPISHIEFLDKGYSFDRKYVLESRIHVRYLLRVSDISEMDARQSDYALVSQLHEMGIACPKPIHFGIHEDDGVCFIVQSYVAGHCAQEALPLLTPGQQYQVGLEAGRTLLRMHESLEPPGPVDDLAIRRGKHALHSGLMDEIGLSFRGRTAAASYFDANLHLLGNRPTTFRHGDYHPGNLIVRDGEFAGVIDFNRSDFGDPIDDFYKLALFGWPLSVPYTRGQIIGYFDGDPPEWFWPLYNLYVAAILPADLVWTHKLYPQHLGASVERVELVVDTHDFEEGGPPAWWAQ